MNTGRFSGRIFAKINRQTTRIGRQDGFTVVELAIGVMLIGIALAVIFISYGKAHNDMAMKSGVSETEAIMQRAYNIAMQEGVEVNLIFWNESGSHPNQCAIYRVYPDGTDEEDTDEPTEPPPPGVSADNDGSGHYWFKIAEGTVGIQSTVTLHFSREGALVRVSGTSMSVTLTLPDRTATVSINEAGEVSS